jgi:hypothetical protein
MQGLRKRPTYNELIQQVENSDDIIKKYPDRRALFMRNHPYLTTLDGVSFMDAMDSQQDATVIEQQKDLMIRTYSAQTQTSHLENRAQMINRGVGDNIIKGRTRDIATGDVNRRDIGTSPTPEIFDMSIDDEVMEAEQDIAQEIDMRQNQREENLRRMVSLTQGMLSDIQGQMPSLEPMIINSEGEQHKRHAIDEPTSTKRIRNSKSDLLELNDNPENTHEPRGKAGRPKGSLKPSAASSSSGASSSSSSSSSTGPVKKTIAKNKQVGIEKDLSKNKSYWKQQNMEYIYKQLELDGFRFTTSQKIGREDVFDPILGKKARTKGKKLSKLDIIGMLYKSRNI